jgi:hypothetical protein
VEISIDQNLTALRIVVGSQVFRLSDGVLVQQIR